MRSLTVAALLAAFAASCATPDYGRPLPEGAPALIALKKGEKRPRFEEAWRDRAELLPAIDHSLEWFARPSAKEHFPKEGIGFDRARASVAHFRELLTSTLSAEEFDARVALEFDVFKSAGWNAVGGGVLFTGYCTPILPGALTADATYLFPLYALPDDLVKGREGEILGQRQSDGSVQPYPTRSVIEASGMLKGKQLELVYLRDPLDAFIAHVNGSAVVKLPDGSERRFGYHGKNGREYKSLGKLLVQDGRIRAADLSLPAIREWGAQHPGELAEYIAKDDSFVFFLPIEGNPKGSLNVEVTGGRTLATDKALFPRGGIVFVDVDVPNQHGVVGFFKRLFSWGKKERYATQVYDRVMVDQDTGGAIRTAGRADIYMGIGDEAEWMAGRTKSPGQLYYLFLKEDWLAQP